MQFTSIIERAGRSAIPYTFEGQPDRVLVLNCYRAEGWTPGSEVVFVMHGIKRNGDEYRDFWIDAAEANNLLIVAPTFLDDTFPDTDNYNNGMVRAADGTVTPQDTWIYHAPARIAETMTEAGLIKAGSARIYGHSAGGQFVHRMVSLVGFGPFRSVIAANSGWYSLPTLDAPFPAGLGGIGLDADDLRRLLASDLWILAGQRDCEATAEHLPTNPEALAQGPGRLQRARNYFAAGRAAADALGVPFGWQKTEVPGVDHDGSAMGRAAAGLWFDGALPSPEALGAGSGEITA